MGIGLLNWSSLLKICSIMFTRSIFTLIQIVKFPSETQGLPFLTLKKRVIFSRWRHHPTWVKTSHDASSIWPLHWKASAVVRAATCEKSGLCQEWSSDSRAGEVSLPCGLCLFYALGTNNSCSMLALCQKHWRPWQRILTLPQPRYHTQNLKHAQHSWKIWLQLQLSSSYVMKKRYQTLHS